MKPKTKLCKNKGCDTKFQPFNSLQKYCSYKCTSNNVKPSKNMLKTIKPINKVSKKQSVINLKYTPARIVYLSKPENKTCFIDGCNKEANTVEHTKGRGQGYFDGEAEINGICKTLDQRFWKPCCIEHNLELENNSELSKKYQLSKLHNGKK